jgi:hypothetical protein
MKKVFLGICLLGAVTLVNARPLDGGGKLKKHHCTEACKKEGHHVYAHGEKGHVCTAACEKPKG